MEYGVADRILDYIDNQKCDQSSDRKIIGIAGAQGSGKTTVARALVACLEERGLSAAASSLDDFYYSKHKRKQLAQEIHPLFEVRGVPGTHDLSLLMDTIKKIKDGQKNISLPVFDKTTDDLVERKYWRQLSNAPDYFILEGWCLGAIPQKSALLVSAINDLESQKDKNQKWRGMVNQHLEEGYKQLRDALDVLFFIKAPNFDVVHDWRYQQEVTNYKTSQKNMPADTKDQIFKFIQYFERITKHMMNGGVSADLCIEIDENRTVL